MGIRTYGLSGSGMDVDQMVKDLMKAQQTKYNTLKQKKTQLEWKKTDYNTMYKAVNEFRTNTVFNYKLQNTLTPKAASVTDSSVLTATANAEAVNFTNEVKVTNLAQSANMTSGGSISISSDKSTLSSQLGITGKINLTISDGVTSKALVNTTDGSNSYDTTGKSIYDLVSDINKMGLNIRASYDATLDRFFLSATQPGAANQISLSSTTGGAGVAAGTGAGSLADKLKLGNSDMLSTAGLASSSALASTKLSDLGVPAAIKLKINDGTANKDLINTTDGSNTYDTTGKTVADVVADINKLGLNVKATFDGSRFSLSSLSGSVVTLTSDDGTGTGADSLADKLKLGTAASLQTNTAPSNFTSGEDSMFTLNGVALNQASNSFTISGITYTLKSEGTTKISVNSDIDKTVANVKAFVDAYNTMLAKVNDEVNETVYKNFLPLTDEQRKEMSESEIKTWEEKAKSGLLRNDSALRTMVNAMRSDVSSPVSGLNSKYNSASSIGITTGAWTEGGKLYLSETQLRNALQEDPEAVSKLFNTESTSGKHNENGIARRLYDSLKVVSDRIYQEAGGTASTTSDTQSNIAKRLTDYTKKMTDLNTRMKAMEERYYKQLDAMEAALNKMSQQSSWLSQQFSS